MKTVYKATDKSQPSFLDFNQPLGMHMSPNNRWVRLAELIPWDEYEKKYAARFKSSLGNVAKPCRMALGALIIQKRLNFSDRELVEEITENPYLQYFIGLPGYQEKPPFDASTLVYFRKRLNIDMEKFMNDKFLERQKAKRDDARRKKAQRAKNDDHNDHSKGGSGTGENTKPETEVAQPASSESDAADSQKVETDTEQPNEGTLIIDATCAPSNIRFPQDFSLLNEAREDLETIIRRICKDNGEYQPRTYCRQARKNYLALAKCRKRKPRKIRKTIKKQLGYIRRDLGYVDSYLDRGYELQPKEKTLLDTIRKVYDQQKYMYDNKTHTVKDRIVSISQPYIRPIVRGKAKAPVEFGIKFDLSLDEDGMGRIEKITFDPYNESEVLSKAVENYRARTGHYPKRVLADQIYRTRNNRRFCKDHGIRLSGPKLGRKSRETAAIDRKIEYQDNTDRIEVERSFSLSKRCYGLGLIRTKREDTSYGSVGLSVFVYNLFRILNRSGCLFFAFFRVLFGTEKSCPNCINPGDDYTPVLS